MNDLINKIHLGDCMDFLKKLPDKSIDLVLTDPPYGSKTEKMKIERTGGTWSRKYQKESGLKVDIRDWDFAPDKEVFDEIFRISKNQIIWGGNYFDLPPTRCFNIWRKLTISESFSMAMCEFAWCSFDKNAKFWEYAPQEKGRFHPTQKPIELIKRQLIEYTKEGDLILDPFSGSGTTARACHDLKRNFICIEKNPYYWEKSVERLEEHKRQLILF